MNLAKKYIRALAKYISYPTLLFFKLIKPFLSIKFVRLDVGRIGHCGQAIAFLSRQRNTPAKWNEFHIFFTIKSTGKVANEQLLKMFQRNLTVVHNFVGNYFFEQLCLVEFQYFKNKIFNLNLPTFPINGKMWHKYIHRYTTPLMKLTDEEVQKGDLSSLKIGIPKDSRIICFHHRDSSYLKKINPERDWTYHNYRDSHLENFLPAMQTFCEENNYIAIRMGQVTEDKIPPNAFDRVIDYANSEIQSDLMDFYFGNRCDFFITSDSGISIIPEIMSKPILYTNVIPQAFFCPWGRDVFIINKVFHDKKTDKPIHFAELIIQRFGKKMIDTELLKNINVTMKENTSDEILEAARELHRFINNKLSISDEDRALQSKYWSFRERQGLYKPNEVNVSYCFLRKYRDLIFNEKVS